MKSRYCWDAIDDPIPHLPLCSVQDILRDKEAGEEIRAVVSVDAGLLWHEVKKQQRYYISASLLILFLTRS